MDQFNLIMIKVITDAQTQNTYILGVLAATSMFMIGYSKVPVIKTASKHS